MKSRLNITAIAVIIFAAIFAKGSQPAKADSSLISYTLTCSSIFTTYDLHPAEYISVAIPGQYPFLLTQYGPGSSSPAVPFFGTFPALPEGTLVNVIIGDSFNNLQVTVPCTNASTSTSNEVTWCNLSEDGRLDAKCGDRIALYCNDDDPTPNLDVWVIDTTSVGHELAKLPLDSLAPTFTKDLGTNGILNGGSDAAGNGWIALSGGPYGGTGTGDWAKMFVCSAD